MSWIILGTYQTLDLNGLTSFDLIGKMPQLNDFPNRFTILDSKGVGRYIGVATEKTDKPSVVAQCFIGIANIERAEQEAV